MPEGEQVITDVDGGTASRAVSRNAPIGIFDSGYGGLTVAREIAEKLPNERLIYVGDSARCPYGPRPLKEVDGFVQQICSFLISQGVKIIVIACNTATAAGLKHAQATFDIPIVGVVEPGARAAVAASRNGRVGVIATEATVESGAYTDAIRTLNPDITVFSTATPRFVEIAELGIRMAEGPIESFFSDLSKVYIRPEFEEISRNYLNPLKRCEIDTLVMGCTHFPLLKTLIGSTIGYNVKLISSAEEVARDVYELLERSHMLARVAHDSNATKPSDPDGINSSGTDEIDPSDPDAFIPSGSGSAPKSPSHCFYTTAQNVQEFKDFGGRVFRCELQNVSHIDLPL